MGIVPNVSYYIWRLAMSDAAACRRAADEIARQYAVERPAIIWLFNDLRKRRNPPGEEFARYCVPPGAGRNAVSRLNAAIVVLSRHYSIASAHARARLGKYYFRRTQYTDRRRRGMEGCCFLFVQTALARGNPALRNMPPLPLPEPRRWCMAASILEQQIVLCDKPPEERESECPLYIRRMSQLHRMSDQPLSA